MSENKRIRVRFAPSPTGPLHIGGVRTALYNYLFAKQHGGDFILRIEDTDSQRFVNGAEAYIIDALQWLGIQPDEGVGVGGLYAPYRQSERKNLYKQYVDQLLSNGLAYIAFDTPDELEQKRKEIPNFQYDASTRLNLNNSLKLSQEEVKNKQDAGAQYVIRFKVEADCDVYVNDLIRGQVCFNSSILDDKVLFKSSDQLPTYHLANIVDDHLMNISHVIRGEEWLPSAPLHVLLYKAFGWEDSMPTFAHLPLLLKPEGNGKLSKRDGDRLGFPVFPCEWIDSHSGEKSSGYREAGYFPEAVVNFLALLGWNPGNEQELFTMDELIATFSLERCSKSGARFDYEKAKWFNHKYLQMKSVESLVQQFLPELEKRGIVCSGKAMFPEFTAENSPVSVAYITRVLPQISMRATFISDLWEQSSFYFERPKSYQEKVVNKFWKEQSGMALTEYCKLLERIDPFLPDELEIMTTNWIAEKEYKTGMSYNSIRLALVGESKGPHLFDIIVSLGKKESIYRIKNAVEILN